jgi:glucose/arabinose dehydrogenase
MSLRRARTPLACLLATVALAACASSDGGNSSSNSSVPVVAAPTTARATTVAPTTAASVAPSTTGGATTSAAAAPTAAPTTAAPVAPVAPAPPAGPNLGAVSVRLTPVVQLEEPIFLTTKPGDPTLYVAERDGRIVAVVDGRVTAEILDMRDLTAAGGERGLLGFAFSPDGGRLYTSYTDNGGDSVVDEYAVAPDGTADVDTRRRVLIQDQPYANHNGGQILFGPDGLLYLGLGDGGSGGDPPRNGLKMSTLLGKLIRIDPRETDGSPYAVPADNPFLDTEGARPEIWSLGLRNPWRFSFDAATGDLWIGDVGQNAVEEVDWVTAAAGAGRGVNFGWSAWEGTRRFNDDQSPDDHTPPVHEYPHGALGCSITGGYVYRGSAVPALYGAYVFADYCAAGLRAIDPADPGEALAISDRPGGIVSFGQGPGNELYALSFDGNVYRVDAA